MGEKIDAAGPGAVESPAVEGDGREERYRAQYRSIPMPTYTWQRAGDDWVLIDFNDAAETFTHGQIRQALGVRASTFFQHEPEVLKDFDRCMREQGSLRHKMLHQLGTTGEIRDLIVHYAFVPPDCIMVLTEDISRQEQAERARLELLEQEQDARRRAETAERTLRTIVDRVPVGIIVVDERGRMVFMNSVGRQISGAPPADSMAVADQAADYVLREPRTGRELAAEETPIARALAGEVVDHYEYIFRRPSDEIDVWVKAVAVPLQDADAQSIGAVAVFEDVTEERALQREKDDFLSAAAHDLKTPLTSIRGFTQLLERYLARDGVLRQDQAAGHLTRISKTSTQMADLINELLDVSRLQMGAALDLNRGRVDLTALVRRVVDVNAEASDSHHLTVKAPEEPLAGVWDEMRLERVVGNLVANAVMYSPDGGPIQISLSREREGERSWAALAIEDAGIGIPAEDLPHIFERFHRGSNVTGQFSGTGIGLAGVKQIVEQHGGTITVESTEGVGSTFTLRLPVHE